MYVVTFYSFKGGVGRSMALANVAASLAKKGRRVLVVDFDIEAPGLDTFELLKPEKKTLGLIDFVNHYLETNQTPDITDYTAVCPKVGENGGSLTIMPCGKIKAYATNLNQIDWNQLYRYQDGYLMMEDLKAQWQHTINPDYVLIDSRTGYTDTSGICTRQLPDAVVALFFPNEQNLRGLSEVVGKVRAEYTSGNNRKIILHFVMSNVPDLDDEDQILADLMSKFKSELEIKSDPMTVHHYNSLSLLNQAVFTVDRPNSRLAREYEEVVNEISIHNPGDRDGALAYMRRLDRPWRWRFDMTQLEEMLARIEKFHRADGEVLYQLAVFKERLRDKEAARVLVNQSIKAGYENPEVYLKRSEYLEEIEEIKDAVEDLYRVFQFNNVSPPLIQEVASRLMRLGKFDSNKVIESAAIASLDHNDTMWLARRFDRTDEDLQFAISLYKKIFNSNNLSDMRLRGLKKNQGLAHMGLRQFSQAKSLFKSKNEALSELPTRTVFHYGMAMWGECGKVYTEVFHRVVEIDLDSGWGLLRDRASSQQCLAVCFWLTGDHTKAKALIDTARQAIDEAGFRTEFSCWRYRKVSSKEFISDLDEMREQLKRGILALPTFVKDSGFEKTQIVENILPC